MHESREHLIENTLWIGAALHLAAHAFYGWGTFEFEGLALVLLASFLAIMTAALFERLCCLRRRSAAVSVIQLFVILALLTLPALGFREKHRYKIITESVQIHEVPRDISLAARAVDKPGHPFRIAVTAGTWPDEDNWMLYHFLGSRLQNTLMCVPITPNGAITAPPRHAYEDLQMDAGPWLNRLRLYRVDVVMAFWPRPVEIRWMEERLIFLNGLKAAAPTGDFTGCVPNQTQCSG